MQVFVHVCVCMYICVNAYVFMYLCMHAFVYVCCKCRSVGLFVHVCLYAAIYVCMYVCMILCMYVGSRQVDRCMCTCICVYCTLNCPRHFKFKTILNSRLNVIFMLYNYFLQILGSHTFVLIAASIELDVWF